MQIGIRLHDTLPMALPERLAHTREQGFSCAHVALSKVIDDFEIKNSTLTPGFAMYLKKLFAQNDLDVAVLGCYLNLADPDGARLAETIEKYKAQIRLRPGWEQAWWGRKPAIRIPCMCRIRQAARRKPYIRLRRIFPVLWNMRKKWEWW